jgi:C4-dicarboxylate-specific signal transduction histidine kinase
MTNKNYNDIRRMMRRIAAISADLEKMAFEQTTQSESAYLYDCSNIADILGHKLERIVVE